MSLCATSSESEEFLIALLAGSWPYHSSEGCFVHNSARVTNVGAHIQGTEHATFRSINRSPGIIEEVNVHFFEAGVLKAL
ncbi:hypothetical protein TNCV_4977191 [Trichonephila clavipes]|nr:hypothetical protein TNCV_4977191 [Trichonephila clavipes]